MKNHQTVFRDKNVLIAILEADRFLLDWEMAESPVLPAREEYEKHLFLQFEKNPDIALYNMGFAAVEIPLSPSMHFLRSLSVQFIKDLSRIPDIEFLREKATASSTNEQDGAPEQSRLDNLLLLMDSAPYLYGIEYFNSDWMKSLYHHLNSVFFSEIKQFPGSVEAYFTTKSPRIHPVGRIYFHLVENMQNDAPFAFLATYSTGFSDTGKSQHLPLKNALVEFKSDKRKLLELLSTVTRASRRSVFIKKLLSSGEIFDPLNLTAVEAYTFLKEIHFYEEAGILCRIPNWWRKSQKIRLSIKVGEKEPSKLGFDALVRFQLNLAMGDDPISQEEIHQLLAYSEGLALIKGKWVEVNHEKLKKALTAYEKAQSWIGTDGLSMLDALRFQMQTATLMKTNEAMDINITNGEWLKSVITQLTMPESLPEVSVGQDFYATLRIYQQRGLAWLNQMKMLRLGACLADDMGLGKTIQVLALLNHTRNQEKEQALLVVPASLIGNWITELERFAPGLRYRVLHPSETKGNSELPDDLIQANDLIMTTYAMLSRYDWLSKVHWNTLILDEAQAIKNPGTKQTKAIKAISSDFRIAMTGTPVENRLSDLWSIFDFLNKGLLGTPKEFTNFTTALKGRPDQYARLKSVVSPFILRRMKTDKRIISDLPEKIEMKTYATLSKKQAALYENLVKDILLKLQEGQQGIQRKGLILSSIMRFKQICNHPDQYLGQHQFNEQDSGKYQRLREICETIYEKRERVLVFTQFKEITTHLKTFLESVFHHEGLVLHGETPVAKRKGLVDTFQGSAYVPFLVLSVKAGGVGLNLTKANHVIHFDRWWNPAVENQATDRAFRIGQQKNVIVHKFITRGTIEEKIDEMIEDKTRLSKEIIIDSQENWITDMSNEELMSLFKLS